VDGIAATGTCLVIRFHLFSRLLPATTPLLMLELCRAHVPIFWKNNQRYLVFVYELGDANSLPLGAFSNRRMVCGFLAEVVGSRHIDVNRSFSHMG
jgi:hypothetical protein